MLCGGVLRCVSVCECVCEVMCVMYCCFCVVFVLVLGCVWCDDDVGFFGMFFGVMMLIRMMRRRIKAGWD